MNKPSYGAGQTPMAPQYNGDPNSFNSYDRSNLANRAMASVHNNTGNQQRQAMAQATAMGGGRSMGNARTAQDIAAQGEGRAGDIANQAGLAGWEDRLKQMGMLNNFNLGRYGTQSNVYATTVGANAEEQQRRQKNLSNALGPVGDLLNL